VLAAADIEVFITTTTFAIMQSLRLDRGPSGPVHPWQLRATAAFPFWRYGLPGQEFRHASWPGPRGHPLVQGLRGLPGPGTPGLGASADLLGTRSRRGR